VGVQMEHYSQATKTHGSTFSGGAPGPDGLFQMPRITGTELDVGPPVQGPTTRSIVAQVRAILGARRRRDRLFEAGLFADPAWDMLLELYLAELMGKRRLSVGCLCQSAAVPATTALRWIRCLEEKGLAQRAPDPVDARRIFINLSDAGFEAMSAFMLSAAPSVPLI
jgi:DNA-binding MarR family transcriptional regulator